MSYMSYCRFEGTLHELRACISDVQDHIDGSAEYGISEEQIDCFRKMVQEMHDFMYDTGILDDNGDIDKHWLDKVCEDMAKGGDDDDCE